MGKTVWRRSGLLHVTGAERWGLLAELHRPERLSRRVMQVDSGPWPWEVTKLCQKLRERGFQLPSGTLSDLRARVVQEIEEVKGRLSRMMSDMRKERHARWKDGLPELWRERPGVIHHWLQAPGVTWGTFPV